MFKSILFIILSISFSFSLFSSEEDKYDFSWLDPDKEVYVLQNRKFRKNKNFYFDIGPSVAISEAFVSSIGFQIRTGYFFKEEWGFEVLYVSKDGKENETAKSVRGEFGTSGSTPFRRIVDSYAGAVLLWSPFYTKVNTFNKIIYLDWIFGLGYGSLSETNNREEFLTGGVNSNPESKSHGAILANTALKFYLTQSWSLRLNVQGAFYQAKIPSSNSRKGSSWQSHEDISLAIGYTF